MDATYIPGVSTADGTRARLLGIAIEAARDYRGMTQPELAKAAGTSTSTISRYETADVSRLDGFLIVRINPDTLLIPKPISSFKRTVKQIAWSAQLREGAGATTIELIFASVSKTGAESIIFQQDQPVASPDFDVLANTADLALLADHKAGTYALRYVREGKILAEGTFSLVK